ncbi:hypothetical protein BLNAU_6590 [Blattamonas nauphoetae]|uniref:Uncharacterized protein n=1 Tax=Blattamonas nauphoetae TaxID=2049346 RepID=A0ABQ9Y483_9EUKA|nr:hypothetical protein BLNAU_6590 [Blattamonas nauphoetae]
MINSDDDDSLHSFGGGVREGAHSSPMSDDMDTMNEYQDDFDNDSDNQEVPRSKASKMIKGSRTVEPKAKPQASKQKQNSSSKNQAKISPRRSQPNKQPPTQRPRPKFIQLSEVEISELQQNNAKLQGEINTLNRDIRRLQPYIFQAQQLESQIIDRKRRNKHLSLELSTLEKSLGEINQSLIRTNDDDDSLPALEQEKSILRDSIKEKEQNLAKINSELKQSDKRNLHISRQIQLNDRQIEDLCQRIRTLQPDSWRESLKSALGPHYSHYVQSIDSSSRSQGGRFPTKSLQREAEIEIFTKKIQDATETKNRTIQGLQSQLEKVKNEVFKAKSTAARLEQAISLKDKEIRLIFLQITGLTVQSNANTRGLPPA